jgi:hypothetical protein
MPVRTADERFLSKLTSASTGIFDAAYDTETLARHV